MSRGFEMLATDVPSPALTMKQVDLKRVVFEYENGKRIVLQGKDLQEWLFFLNKELYLLQNRDL